MLRRLMLIGVCLVAFLAGLAQTVISPTFFGMHAHGGSMPWIKIGTYRSWDSGCRWNALNPAYGSYRFSYCFGLFDQARSVGATQTIFTFGEVPQWASTEPWLTGCSGGNNGACAPPYLSDWTAFVSALARYSAAQKASGHKGITLYELWNEPNAANFWRGSSTQMVTLAKAAYPLIHQYDPTAKVATPTPQGTHGYSWMSNYFAAGGARYADAIDFHGYTGTAMPENGIANVNAIRSLMSAYGVSGKPLNDTEHFWWGYGGTDTTRWLSRHLILNASLGIASDAWYGWTWGGSLSGTANANVYAELQKWLTGTTVSRFTVVGARYTVPLTRSGVPNLIVWSTSGTVSVPTVGFTKYVDVWGTTHSFSGSSIGVGTLPILLMP